MQNAEWASPGLSLYMKRVAHLADDVTGERHRHPSGGMAD
jgi:hypothetical protein